jgi:sulfur carrier protein
MIFTLNGEPRAVADGTTVAALIATLGLRDRRVAVEVNRDIIPRDGYAARTVSAGDIVEIVHFVGGG